MTLYAKRPIRRASTISPFGVGSVVDFPKEESLIMAGLEAWPQAFGPCPQDWLIREERLEARLGTTHFRSAPHYTDASKDESVNNKTLPALQFPKWHVCGFCGQMKHGPQNNRLCSSADCQGKKRRLTPIRFVAACEQGHLTDIPWMAYVHGEVGVAPDEAGHVLTYSAGSSAGLSGIWIKCSCGKTRSLGGLFQFDRDRGGVLSDVGALCTGNRPWLDDSAAACGQHLRPLQKGASNIYFPHVMSAIYLPLWAEEAGSGVIPVINDPRYYTPLTDGLEDGRISIEIARIVANIARVDAEQLRDAAQRKLDGLADISDEASDVDFRFAEYEAIRNERGGAETELFVQKREITSYTETFRNFFSSVYQIPKLRETRVLRGFSRILPPKDDSENVALLTRKATGIGWLPASVVHGEGIFLEFRRDKLHEFERRDDVRRRCEHFAHTVNENRLLRGQEPLVLNPSYFMIHAFAHLMIRQLCFDCGYGSSALRERLYSSSLDDPNPMHGLLIYTSAGDSEGTLGGLVRQGEPGTLERVVEAALHEAEWCSSDPICIESSSQGTDGANLAACHSCTLLPETACETGNRYLDRAMLIGLPNNPALGFFRS